MNLPQKEKNLAKIYHFNKNLIFIYKNNNHQMMNKK